MNYIFIVQLIIESTRCSVERIGLNILVFWQIFSEHSWELSYTFCFMFLIFLKNGWQLIKEFMTLRE